MSTPAPHTHAPACRVLVVIGPSGVGKSTLFAALRRDGTVRLVPTWTTRRPRHYEVQEDADHVFVDEDAFAAHERAGGFLDTVRLFGLDARYGLPREVLQEDACIRVVMLRAMLLQRLPACFPPYRVYQVEAPRARVEAHLRARAERDGDIGSRLAHFDEELHLGRTLAHRVVDNSDTPERVLRQLRTWLSEDFAQGHATA